MAIFLLAVVLVPSFFDERIHKWIYIRIKSCVFVTIRELFLDKKSKALGGWKVSKQYHRYINACPRNEHENIIFRIVLLKLLNSYKKKKERKVRNSSRYSHGLNIKMEEDTKLFMAKEEKKHEALNLSYMPSSSTTVEIYTHYIHTSVLF